MRNSSALTAILPDGEIERDRPQHDVAPALGVLGCRQPHAIARDDGRRPSLPRHGSLPDDVARLAPFGGQAALGRVAVAGRSAERRPLFAVHDGHAGEHTRPRTSPPRHAPQEPSDACPMLRHSANQAIDLLRTRAVVSGQRRANLAWVETFSWHRLGVRASAWLCSSAYRGRRALRTVFPSPNRPDSVKFAAIGDKWHWRSVLQHEVAQQTTTAHATFKFDLGIRLSDNVCGEARVRLIS